MGAIRSVSLPSITTCRPDAPCAAKCYARKIERLRPNVKNSYSENYEILKNDPQTYWREVEAAVMMSRFFRFHVSGDIVDMEYLINMSKIAVRNPHCEILCFTKKYEIVNEFLTQNFLPKNLHIIFSAWVGLNMTNPFSLPEAHVMYRNGVTTASKNAKQCEGNCAICAAANGGCWSLKHGEQIVFKEH